MRHGSRHVGDAVEQRLVHREGGIGVRGGVRILEAAALVHGDVDEDAARTHPGDQCVADQLRRLRSGNKHRADHEVGLDHGLLDLEAVGCDGLDPARVERIEFAEAGDVRVEHGDVRAEAHGDRDRIRAGHAAAEDGDDGGVRSGNAGDEQAGAAVGLQHRVRAHDGSEPAGDLAHRCEQREGAVRKLHRLVGDRGDAPVDECPRQRLVRGEVQVGEQDEPATEVAVLALDRLLHLEDEFGFLPGARGVGQDGRPCVRVQFIRDGRAASGAGLDEHVVPVGDQVVDAGRGDRHPELVVLDFAGDRDLHEAPITSTWWFAPTLVGLTEDFDRFSHRIVLIS